MPEPSMPMVYLVCDSNGPLLLLMTLLLTYALIGQQEQKKLKLYPISHLSYCFHLQFLSVNQLG